MILFGAIVSFIFMIIITRYYLGVHVSKVFLKSVSTETKEIKVNRLALVIPVFKEQLIINETIAYFESIRVKMKLDVYYVTTDKEGISNSTKDIIISKIGADYIIHYPKKYGYKASQLNYALSRIKNNYDFIGIFDADSKPDSKGLERVAFASREIDILQMPSIYNSNYDRLGILSKANAIFQTRWTFCYEIPQWIRWSKNPKRGNIMYLVGHGLFLNTRLITNQTFNQKTVGEDLYFGYKSSLSNKKIQLIPFFDHCSCPKSLLGNISQTSRWYYEEFILPFCFLKRIIHKPLLYLRLVARYFHILMWALGPIMVICSIFIFIIKANYWLLSFISLEVWFYVFFLHRYIAKIVGNSYRLCYISILIKSIVNCIGPLLCIFRIISYQKVDFNKTKR